MAKKAQGSRVTRMDALRLHAEANKSDPFAAKRMAMTFKRDGFKEVKEVHAESQRIIAARDQAVRKAFNAWKMSEQRAAMLHGVKAGEGVIGSALNMSMFKNKADYDAAVAA
jgi:hypothetical protein